MIRAGMQEPNPSRRIWRPGQLRDEAAGRRLATRRMRGCCWRRQRRQRLRSEIDETTVWAKGGSRNARPVCNCVFSTHDSILSHFPAIACACACTAVASLACGWRGKSTSCKRCGVRGRGANQPSIACVLRGEHQPTPATVRDEGGVLQEAKRSVTPAVSCSARTYCSCR